MKALDNRYKDDKYDSGFQKIGKNETDGYEDTVVNSQTKNKG